MGITEWWQGLTAGVYAGMALIWSWAAVVIGTSGGKAVRVLSRVRHVLVCACFRKGASMKRINCFAAVTLALSVVLCLLAAQMLSAQSNLKAGKVLERTELKAAPGWEAILVERDLPPGAQSGKHTQSGNEIVYIEEGSVIFEAQGKPAVTLKAGRAFTTVAGEVHNVKNASSSAPAKALAFYVAKKGTRLEDLSAPSK